LEKEEEEDTTPRTEQIAHRKKDSSDSLIMKHLTVVLGPPAKVVATDNKVIDKAPRHIVERGQETSPYLRKLEETYSEHLVQNPLEQWCWGEI